jgi:hypothetical protein
MPRYVVQRTFPAGPPIPLWDQGEERCRRILERNAEEGVTWINSFVSEDGTRSFCIYDAPSPEAVRRSSARSELPVDQITRVSVLDPYSYASRRLPARYRSSAALP